jgi:hypothetical protein
MHCRTGCPGLKLAAAKAAQQGVLFNLQCCFKQVAQCNGRLLDCLRNSLLCLQVFVSWATQVQFTQCKSRSRLQTSILAASNNVTYALKSATVLHVLCPAVCMLFSFVLSKTLNPNPGWLLQH